MAKSRFDIQKDFADFVTAGSPQNVPPHLLTEIKRKLFPNPFKVFFKLLFIQSALGAVSLSVCHQFGVNPFKTSWSLADWFMSRMGHAYCFGACGFVYMAGTLAAVQFFLSLEEVNVIQNKSPLFIVSVMITSLVGFMVLGADVFSILGLIWVMGAGLGSVLSWRFVVRIRVAMS